MFVRTELFKGWLQESQACKSHSLRSEQIHFRKDPNQHSWQEQGGRILMAKYPMTHEVQLKPGQVLLVWCQAHGVFHRMPYEHIFSRISGEKHPKKRPWMKCKNCDERYPRDSIEAEFHELPLCRSKKKGDLL